MHLKANVLEGLKSYEKAIENYEISIDINGEDINVYALYHQIGFCYSIMDDYQKAIEFYSFAIDLKSQHPNSEFNPDEEGIDMGVLLGLPYKRMYNNRANSYLKIERLDESFNDCVTSINYDKSYSFPYITLSHIYSKRGREEQALELLKISAQYGNKNAILTLKKMGWRFE